MFCKNGVGNLEGAVRWAIEAISVAGTIKLLRYGIANEGHRLAALQVHILKWARPGLAPCGLALTTTGQTGPGPIMATAISPLSFQPPSLGHLTS